MKCSTFDPVKTRTGSNESESGSFDVGNHTDLITRDQGTGFRVCEAVGCLAQATTAIDVKVGHNRTIRLSLCKNCIGKFVGGDE